ncbi:hypothetical protein ACQY0O_001649 [Thecaphora frezii]
MPRQFVGTDRFPPYGWLDLPASELAHLGIAEEELDGRLPPPYASNDEVRTDARGHACLCDGRKLYTLVFPMVRMPSPTGAPDCATTHLLLGQKKRGFGPGGWNGFGGKIQLDLDGSPTVSTDAGQDLSTILHNAAWRELNEECGLDPAKIDLASCSPRTSLAFCGVVDISVQEGERLQIHVFVVRVPPAMMDEVRETDEMRPRWFPLTAADPALRSDRRPALTAPGSSWVLDVGQIPFGRMRPESPLFLALVLDRLALPSASEEATATFRVDVKYLPETTACPGEARRVDQWSVLVDR